MWTVYFFSRVFCVILHFMAQLFRTETITDWLVKLAVEKLQGVEKIFFCSRIFFYRLLVKLAVEFLSEK